MRLLCFFLLAANCLLFGQAPAPQYEPLNSSERWRRYWKGTLLSPGLYFASLGAGSGAQLGNEPPEWGQGLRGYGRRSASRLGVFVIDETIHQGSAAALGTIRGTSDAPAVDSADASVTPSSGLL